MKDAFVGNLSPLNNLPSFFISAVHMGNNSRADLISYRGKQNRNTCIAINENNRLMIKSLFYRKHSVSLASRDDEIDQNLISHHNIQRLPNR